MLTSYLGHKCYTTIVAYKTQYVKENLEFEK